VAAVNAPLRFTGERFLPGVKGEIWIEHWHRYHFARRWAAGRRVLDVACGEGYGSALLARSAAHVTGVDLSPAAIAHAKGAYAGVANLEYLCASCTELPLADGSIDLAVSFETIEHITGQERFVQELARVLRPDGILLLSCPNKLEYSDKRGFANEFHVRELYREELAELVRATFPESRWFGQRPTFFSVIVPEVCGPAAAAPPAGATAGELLEAAEEAPAEASPVLSAPLYFLVAASRDAAALDAVAPALSVFSDRDDWVYRDYSKVMRELQAVVPRAEALEAALAEAREALAQRDHADRTREAELVARDLQLGEKSREIERRGGWRWWLRLPLVRLGLLE
jgi:SAM-dependent methyltransferase